MASQTTSINTSHMSHMAPLLASSLLQPQDAGFGYPTVYPPDPSCYLYLQQHLLLLHHQHLEMTKQIHTSTSVQADFLTHPHFDTFGVRAQQTTGNNNKAQN